MAYQGISPYLYKNNLTNVQILDDISGSFNGTTTQFNLTVGGSLFHAVSARSLFIVLGGIVQKPNVDYNVSAGVITFTIAPIAGLTFSGRNIYGLNQITGVNDGVVSPSKLTTGGPSWDSSGNLTITGDLTVSGGDVLGNIAGNLTGQLNLNSVNDTISDTAVDIFVYDTRKDSDGGAWRKRTQNTSWYNETLNTSTRGSRREFPSVAVLVLESNKLTIYDGDDPDMPMWMVFQGEAGITGTSSTNRTITTVKFLFHHSGLTSVFALNGIIAIGALNYQTFLPNFVSDSSIVQVPGYGDYTGGFAAYSSPLSGRNSSGIFTRYSTEETLYSAVNDVAMTVLPNAPIDSATGLPVPTIAVATNAGVSIIKDDRTICNNVNSNASYTFSRYVNFSPNGDLVFELGDQTGLYSYIYTLDGVNTSNNTITLDTRTSTSKDVRGFYRSRPTNFGLSNLTKAHLIGNYPGIYSNLPASTYYRTGIHKPLSMTNYNHAVVAFGAGLNLISEGTPYKSAAPDMICGITTTFNSGWLCGDIKGAWLSDTSTTSLVGTELITNGDFATNISGWTASSSPVAVLSFDTNRIRVQAGYAYQAVTTVVGRTYIVSFDLNTSAGFPGGVYMGNSIGGYEYFTTGALTTGTHIYTFTATTTTAYIHLWAWNAGTTYAIYDNVSIRLADIDRTSNNKPLAVYGTINRSIVATGSNLVSYSGFSANNYLQQPLNTSFNFGSSDFCVMGWFKLATNNSQQCLMMLGNTTGELDYFLVEQQNNGDMRFQVDSYNGACVAYHTTLPTGVWLHYCGLKIGNRTNLYINGSRNNELNNGVLIDPPTSSFDIDTTPGLYIGRRDPNNSANAFAGEMALWRISASIPSPEQIAKIYEDEKELFMENSQCTLYGTSDTITGIAYDDSTRLLHVGTASGRSDFQGLRRINNTTTAVTTAISASNGLISEQ